MTRINLQLPLYLSAPHTCSYLPDRLASTLFADPDQPMDMETYNELIHYGFRRSGRMVYAPRCEGCQQCVSVRVPVDAFAPRRVHRRILQANADVRVREHRPGFNPEHFALYRRYTDARHGDGEMATATAAEYLGFLRADWSRTVFLEFHIERRLVAVAATDQTGDGLSAVYTFFEPDLAARSLGCFCILTQIERSRALGLPYLYLGYWVRDCRKMAYKVNYRPIELWRNGQWQRFGPGESLPG